MEQIKRIPFLDDMIKHVKETHTLGMAATAFIKGRNGELIVAVIMLEKKYQTKLSLEALKRQSGSKEIILVQEAWMVSSNKPKEEALKIIPSESPDRKECILINYFTPEKCLTHTFVIEKDKNDKKKIVWKEEIPYWEMGTGENNFNPFRFTEEDIDIFTELSLRDEIRENGKLERIDLLFGCHMDTYRKDGKVFFEAINGNGKAFYSLRVTEEDEEFKKSLNSVKEFLTQAGALKRDDEKEKEGN
jgi:hypothetical protein